LTNEIGTAARIFGLSLDVALPPAQTLSNFTIRLRHTGIDRYGNGNWETNWTTVWRQDASIITTGWTHFAFSPPFDYNGRSNLMVDISFDDSSFTADGLCRSSGTTQLRSLYFRSDSAFGPPLNWPLDGVPNKPAGTLISRVPNLRLLMGATLPVNVVASNGFVGGLWSGTVSIAQMTSNLFLRAVDSAGHFGDSASFTTVPLRIAAVSRAGNGVTISIASISGYRYVVEGSTSVSDGWSVVSPVLDGTGAMLQFTHTPPTPLQFYRVRLAP
jgi:hypothetical protein